MSPGQPVPIVRRAPAAGLFGRRGDAPAPADKAGTTRFPWEQLLFGGDPVDAAPMILPFPIAKT